MSFPCLGNWHTVWTLLICLPEQELLLFKLKKKWNDFYTWHFYIREDDILFGYYWFVYKSMMLRVRGKEEYGIQKLSCVSVALAKAATIYKEVLLDDS